jgi:hypothetical protein
MNKGFTVYSAISQLFGYQASRNLIQEANISKKSYYFNKILQKQIYECGYIPPAMQQFSQPPLAVPHVILPHTGAITVEAR